MKTLAVIPARGGSKGIPGKNIVKLGGKPLIAYTINQAQKSKLVDKFIVSTDDKKIANVAKSFGAEVPFLRPKNFSGDFSQTVDTLIHALKFLKEKMDFSPDIVLLLQPTSPFRTSEMIDRSIRLLKNSKAGCVISVSELKKHPFSSFFVKNNFLEPFREDFENFSLRQKKPKLYYPTGAIYTFWTKNLLNSSIYGKKIKPMILNDEKINIDIDTPFDLFVAEMIIKNERKFLKR